MGHSSLLFVRLPKSVQLLNIESSEFGPAVAICPVYIEARFGQIARYEVSQVRYHLASTQAEGVCFGTHGRGPDEDKNRGHYLLMFLSYKSTNDQT